MLTVPRYIRRQVMDVPMLYRIWFERYRRQKKGVKLPSPEDSLYLDGFPRSGNTYFSAAVRDLFPSLEFAHHLHCLAPLRIAVRNGLPAFVLLREPKAAIASRVIGILTEPGRWEMLSREEIVHRLVDDWRRYYLFCERNLNNLTLIAFEDAVDNPYPVLLEIARKAGLAESADGMVKFREFHARFSKHDREKPQGSTSFPDAKRRQEKEAVIPLLKQLREYREAESVYHRLRIHSLVID